MTGELTDKMKAVLRKLGETNHGRYNGGVIQGLARRGLVEHPPYTGLVLTEKGYFHWLFLIGEIDEITRDQLLETSEDD